MFCLCGKLSFNRKYCGIKCMRAIGKFRFKKHNPERMKKQFKDYYCRNKEKLAAKRRKPEYRKKDNERHKRRRLANPEYHRAKSRDWYAKNRDRVLRRLYVYRKNNPIHMSNLQRAERCRKLTAKMELELSLLAGLLSTSSKRSVRKSPAGLPKTSKKS